MSLAAQAEDDVFKFGEYVFGYQAAIHHREMVDFINGCRRDRVNGLVLEPRGFAKSTWGTNINLSHTIGMEKDIRVGLMSKSAPHADAFSRGIRWTLERNEKYRGVFGDLVSQVKWTDGEWLRAESRWHGSQYSTVYAQGVGGQIVSKRFDLLHCDDILDKENTATRDQIAKVEEWFWQTLIPCLAPDGVAIVIGTRWAEGDLYEVLMDKGWRVLKRAALVPHPKKEDVYTSLWPEIWSVERLMELKELMGSSRFACAMLNDISGLREGDIFKHDWFRYASGLPTDRQYIVRMGVDLASSTRETADYTTRVITAEDTQGNYFVLDAIRRRISSGHLGFVHEGWKGRNDISAVIIENQQFQSTLIQQLMEEHPEMPVISKRADTDKQTRARAVAAKYEAGKVYHLETLRDSELETEELSFPKGHDDMIDALGYSMDLGGTGFVFGSLKT